MISAFDLEKLRKLLKDFYEITKIRITVFDENRSELVSYPDTIAPFCEIVRSVEQGRSACASCDHTACEIAASKRKTHIYRCHAGLTEAVTPILAHDVLVGYLLFGHVFAYPDYDTGWQAIRPRVAALPVEEECLREAVGQQPLITKEYVASATQIMSAVASYLVMERMATLQDDPLAAQLDRYLSDHFTENFTAKDLCDRFHIGKTRLYEIADRLYGHGIAEQVRKLRIEKAQELLAENRRSLSEIAEQCGYADYNYFISVFSKVVGTSPRRWHQENQRR